MITLGIETSCDETAIALIETRGDLEYRVIASLVHSQAELHSAYGGVFPTLAKREHGRNLVPLLAKVLQESPADLLARGDIPDEEFRVSMDRLRKEYAGQNPDLMESFAAAGFLKKTPPIDLIAVTEGPGLEPALWTGIVFAEMLGRLWNVPVVPINHMEGHVVGSLLESDRPEDGWQRIKTPPLPSLAFLISGGHTQLIKMAAAFDYQIIGETRDDAVGETFDKAARLLGLPYPGGPLLSKLAAEAREEGGASPVKLPRPMIDSGDLAFSFSGLKTAVLYAVRSEERNIPSSVPSSPLSNDFKKGLAREFEDAVAETLSTKLRAAIEATDAKAVIVGGGVSANALIRDDFQKLTAEFGIPLYLPSLHVSGDNALMIALAGALSRHIPSPDSESEKPPERRLRAEGTKRLGS